MCYFQMGLDLPDNNQNYKDPEYWNTRFKSEDSYEWLVEYKEVKNKLSSILQNESSKILQLGCGNSNFANDLYKDGYTDITNIDISEVCVQKMSTKYPHMSFKTMDMTAMAFQSHSFDFVFEKATLDSLLVDCKSPWDLSDPSQITVLKALKEVKKVLKPGGLFISLTFSQPHFRVPLLASPGLDWSVEVDKFGSEGKVLDYYLMVCRDGDPGPALAKWTLRSGPVIISNETWSSSDEENEFISKLETSCFDSDSEDESNSAES